VRALSPLRHTAYVHTDNDPRVKLLHDVPGVWSNSHGKGRRVRCSVDAVIPVRNILKRLELPARVELPPAFIQAHKRRDDLAWGASVVADLVNNGSLAPLVDGGRTVWDWMKLFQCRGVTRGAAYGGGHLWQDPGSGKTVQEVVLAYAIAATAPGYDGEDPMTAPILFLTKASVRYQFARQVRRFTTDNPYVCHPGGKPLGEYLQSCGPTVVGSSMRWAERPVLVFSWTDLRRWGETLAMVQPKVLVLDETHIGKAPKRVQWVSDGSGRPVARPLNNLSYCAGELVKRIPNVVGATATDVDNLLDDLWAQLDLVQSGRWGRTFSRFTKRYCGAMERDGGGLIMTEPTHAAELRLRLSTVGYRVPHTITHAGLPAKTRSSVWVPQEAQVRPLGSWAGEFAAAARITDRNERDEQRKMLKVAQAASRKRNVVVEFVVDRLQRGQKVLLLDMWRANCTALYERIAKAWPDAVTPQQGPRPGPANCGGVQDPRSLENLWCVMGGSDRERDWVQRRYMGEGLARHPGPACVIGTMGAIGTGLDWHDSDMLGFPCIPYKHGTLKQAEDRVWRQGLTRRVEIVYFFAEGTYDERLVEILEDKAYHVEAVGGRADAVRDTMEALHGIVGHEDEIQKELLDFVKNSAEGDW